MQRKIFLNVLLVLTVLVARSQPSEAVINYINTYKELAIEEMQRTGVPAAITLAQGIHETEAGRSDLVRRSNNHFGIKCKSSWTGDKVYHDDDARGECFRSYAKPDESYRDHSDFLKNGPRYAALFQLEPEDYKGWATGLKKAGYATNYRYPQILVKLIEDYNLQQYTFIAMGKMKATDEVLAGGGTNSTLNTSSIVIQAVSATGQPGTIKEPEVEKPVRVQPVYPTGEFSINNTRVVFVKAGTALLSVAEQYNISFARLLDFNDLNNGDILKEDQLIYLQRKRKTGANEFHTIEAGETIYYVCQLEGIRMESMLALNRLSGGMEPAEGEKLYLRQEAPARPLLVQEKRTILQQTTIEPAAPAAEYTTHVVQTKETLYSISRKYGVSLERLKEWNKLDSLSVKTGQQLVIYKN
jgi:LysM repeat protein